MTKVKEESSPQGVSLLLFFTRGQMDPVHFH